MAIALLTAAGTPQPTVSVGEAKWDELPPFKVKTGPFDGSAARAHLREIITSKACNFEGSTSEAFNIEVPYAILLTPEGRIQHVLIAQMNCRPLEALVGAMVIQPDALRRIQPPGGDKPAWYGGKIKFVN